jgi:molybdate transport system substrate-binding protein
MAARVSWRAEASHLRNVAAHAQSRCNRRRDEALPAKKSYAPAMTTPLKCTSLKSAPLKSFAIAACVVLFVCPLAHAADLALLAAGASKETVSELIPGFEKATGHTVVATWATAPAIARRLADGEAFDLVITSADDIDGFIAKGRLASGSRTDLMKTGVGVAVRAGAPRPDIGSTEALKRALLAAPTIGRSAGTSGDYIAALFARLGLAGQLLPRLKQVPPGKQVADMLVAGDVEIGLQQASELIHAPGIAYLGPLPAELQKTTVYAAGIPTGARQPAAAKALVETLTGPAAASAIRHNGMDPG